MKTRVGEITLPGQLPSVELSRSQLAQADEEAETLLDMQDELGMSRHRGFPETPAPELVQRVLDGINNLPLREDNGSVDVVDAKSGVPVLSTPVAEPQTILGFPPPDFIRS